MKPQKNRARDIGFYALILVLMLATIFMMTSQNQVKKYVYSDIIDLFEQEKVQTFYIEGSNLVLTLRDETDDNIDNPEVIPYKLYNVNWFKEDLGEVIDEQYAAGIIEEYNYDVGFVAPWWLTLIPYLLIIAAVLILLNTYPLLACQTLVFQAKQSILTEAQMIASNLAELGELGESGVEQVMTLVGDSNLTRIVVTDSDAQLLYDTQESARPVRPVPGADPGAGWTGRVSRLLPRQRFPQ